VHTEQRIELQRVNRYGLLTASIEADERQERNGNLAEEPHRCTMQRLIAKNLRLALEDKAARGVDLGLAAETRRRAVREVILWVRSSRLLFLAEFLESGIGAQWVPEGIEPKKCRCNGNRVVKRPSNIKGL
jgi:hypothetical protein